MKIKKSASDLRDLKRNATKQPDNYGKPVDGYSTTESVKPQPISSFLRKGKDNVTRSSELIEMLNLRSRRDLRHVVARARENGEIILSDSNGYYLPADGVEGVEEIRRCYRILRAKGISTLKAAAAIRKPLKAVYGQQSITDIQPTNSFNVGTGNAGG